MLGQLLILLSLCLCLPLSSAQAIPLDLILIEATFDCQTANPSQHGHRNLYLTYAEVGESTTTRPLMICARYMGTLASMLIDHLYLKEVRS